MAYQPVEELLPRSNMSVYRLMRMAAKRAGELGIIGGQLVACPPNQKLATTALEEIRAGKVVEKSVHDAANPKGKKK